MTINSVDRLRNSCAVGDDQWNQNASYLHVQLTSNAISTRDIQQLLRRPFDASLQLNDGTLFHLKMEYCSVIEENSLHVDPNDTVAPLEQWSHLGTNEKKMTYQVGPCPGGDDDHH